MGDDRSAHYYTWGADIRFWSWTSDLSPAIGCHYRLKSLPPRNFEVLALHWLISGHSKWCAGQYATYMHHGSNQNRLDPSKKLPKSRWPRHSSALWKNTHWSQCTWRQVRHWSATSKKAHAWDWPWSWQREHQTNDVLQCCSKHAYYSSIQWL